MLWLLTCILDTQQLWQIKNRKPHFLHRTFPTDLKLRSRLMTMLHSKQFGFLFKWYLSYISILSLLLHKSDRIGVFFLNMDLSLSYPQDPNPIIGLKWDAFCASGIAATASVTAIRTWKKRKKRSDLNWGVDVWPKYTMRCCFWMCLRMFLEVFWGIDVGLGAFWL